MASPGARGWFRSIQSLWLCLAKLNASTNICFRDNAGIIIDCMDTGLRFLWHTVCKMECCKKDEWSSNVIETQSTLFLGNYWGQLGRMWEIEIPLCFLLCTKDAHNLQQNQFRSSEKPKREKTFSVLFSVLFSFFIYFLNFLPHSTEIC